MQPLSSPPVTGDQQPVLFRPNSLEAERIHTPVPTLNNFACPPTGVAHWQKQNGVHGIQQTFLASSFNKIDCNHNQWWQWVENMCQGLEETSLRILMSYGGHPTQSKDQLSNWSFGCVLRRCVSISPLLHWRKRQDFPTAAQNS